MEAPTNPGSRTIPSKSEVTAALGTFSPLERFLFLWAVGVAIVSVLVILSDINQHFMVSIPAEGGTLREGIIGTPRFINPVLATTDADRDLSALVYRGLMKRDASDTLVPDLADSYTISDDGLVYTFKLKSGITFQDGTAITAADVEFTTKAVQDASLKSAHRIEWEGVKAEIVDPSTITFTLKQPYAPFLQSTTLGILPKAVWEKTSYDAWIYSDLNTKNVVGSGEWKVSKVATDSSGIPSAYTLNAVRQKNAQTPLIDKLQINLYPSESALADAYTNGAIDALGGIDPGTALTLSKQDAIVSSTPLPRVFGLFFNQKEAPIFTDAKVRQAVNMALDKDAIVHTVLSGYGTAINGPIPSLQQETLSGDIAGAKNLLEKDGWVLGDDGIYLKQVSKKETDRLSFQIATGDVPELSEAVHVISDQLKAAGIEATPKVYEAGALNQNVLRPRKFDSLFFGEVVSDQSDLFAFWHSTQRTDPGLNISGYANAKVDSLLTSALKTTDPTALAGIYANFEKEIDSDMPAAFVYSPSYIYVTRPTQSGAISLGKIQSPENRFAGIDSWYLDTDRIWKIFEPKTDS